MSRRPLIGMSERPIPLSAVWSYAQITLIRAARSAAAARWDLRQIGGYGVLDCLRR
jgi:hypothetical protein